MSKAPKKFCICTDFGVGDCIMSTVGIRNLKKKYPDCKIYVASVYPFVYENNPHIEKLYQLGHPSIQEFYLEHVRECGFNEVINLKWYERNYHTKYGAPLSKAACELLSVPFDEDKTELYLSDDEVRFARSFMKSFKKPIVLIQGFGSNVRGAGQQMTNVKDWTLDGWAEVVDKGKHLFDFVQMGGDGEPTIPGAANICGQTDWRQSFAIINEAFSFVAVDSFLQHAALALDTKGVVLFGRSNPITLGHDYHINVSVPESCPDIYCGRPEGGFGDMEIRPDGNFTHWTCPHLNCMKAIKSDMVLEQLFALKKEEDNKYK